MADMTIWYMAHPVAGDAQANAQRALRWLHWLRVHEPNAIVIAPWLASLLSGDDDTDPKQRERALRESDVVVSCCDGIVLVGGRISSGMQREIDRCAEHGGIVCDLTALGDEPPSDTWLQELFRVAERADPYAPPSNVFELGQRQWEA